MANHTLETFSGGKYGPNPDAALYPEYDYVFAAEQKRNPTEGLVQKLGRTAAGWLRKKLFTQKQESQTTDLDATAYTPRHALTSETVPPSHTPYAGRHRKESIQAIAVHTSGGEGLYRSAYAAETSPTLNEHLEEVSRLRDAMTKSRQRRIPQQRPQRVKDIKPQDAYASFSDTLPPPADQLHPPDVDIDTTVVPFRRRHRPTNEADRYFALVS